HDFSCSNLTGNTVFPKKGNTAIPASFGPVRSAALLYCWLAHRAFASNAINWWQRNDPGLKSCGYSPNTLARLVPGQSTIWES
ncbi:hypothetical protein, partial [Klebsiella pneumoniae]|uniref:hypothetical protein n=1 Tax=Klebsiella pneumoniae TaxID=573 RepID=UPI00226EB684